MTWTRRRIFVGLAVLAIAALSAAIARYVHEYPVHHFGVVEEGVLYRGGQPDETALGRIVSRYGIRTVVNLRGETPGQPWYDEEEEFCQRRGVRMIDIRIGDPASAEAKVREFLAVVSDARNRPVFVHCQHGSARAGFAVAARRILVDGWSYQAAVAEAEGFQFHPEHANREYARILARLAGGSEQRSSPPESVSVMTTIRREAAPTP